MGPEATHAYKYDQLYVGLKAEIYGEVHGVQSIWDAKSTEENWDFYLLTQRMPLIRLIKSECWTVCHLWPSGSHFVLSCYHHHY